ncbi:hypothetical protein [Paractinoplanes atraurantiacus]|uniref:Uncharacterized protein n=1 Tax=Paractinoplanes atraurantiacus TaxID=1036182 RepID=A0A285F549_9ACTN|nr:hypothetical protein [Actinoplanes atraurantiacus]SNY06402.1 hypothetical protein SAMN05421748_101709 [Actinoplanes atraurantiacus]
MTAESAAGAFREATDLVRETAGWLGEAWQQFAASVRDLIGRARLFLREDGVWSSVVRHLPADVTEAIATIDALLGRLGPGINRIIELLRVAAGRTVSVLSLVETAFSRWLGNVSAGTVAYVASLGHLGAELTGQLVGAAIEADDTAAAGLPAYAGNLRRLADRVDLSVRRSADWAADLQRLMGEARAADLR